MKILLLGANGQVGFELHRSLAPLGELVAATRDGSLAGDDACEQADLADPDGLRALVARVAPSWVVNAAAYTAVDAAEDAAPLAQALNGDALAALGAAARDVGADVLHFSTDYVFAGDARSAYREDDACAPVNAYGRSKLAGELALRESGARHLVFRTAWVYSSRGRNFLLSMLKLAATRERLGIVSDQLGAPTPARLLADVAAHAMTRATAAGDGACWGTFHVTASGIASWHDFACEIVARAAAAGLLPRAVPIDPIASGDFPTRARRPAWSVLDCSRLERVFGLVMPHWRCGVARCIAEIAAARSR